MHLQAIYAEGELREEATCKEILQVRSEGNRSVSRNLKHYNLEAVLTVGYRVRGHRGTQFRQWATARLSEYLVKGFAMDDALRVLNRIANAYLEFAELQAQNRKAMTMNDWIAKLDDFLKLSDRELLDHAGKISADAAKAKAAREYEQYRALEDTRLKPVDADFERAAKRIGRQRKS